jgi:tripartite-type tricarboxylate transporter receptor subunit TctC
MLVVTPTVEANDFKAFIAYLKVNPGRLSYGSVGGGSASHLTMELLKNDAGVFIVHIPYRGFPPAVTDMLSGNIQAMFAIIPAVLPQVRAGKLKALAVTGLKRSALASDVPSVAELGYPQLESLAWIGLLAPAGTPAEVVNRLHAEATKAMRAPDTRDALGKQGFRCGGELAGGIFRLDPRRAGEVVESYPRQRRDCRLTISWRFLRV